MEETLKKVGLGCLGVMVILVVAAVIMGRIAEKHDGPRQSISFLNTSDEIRSVTFSLSDDPEEEHGYFVNATVEPGKYEIKRVSPDKYTIKVWNAEDKLIDKYDNFVVTLEDPGESDYHLERFDLAMDKDFAIVNLNFLYEGNSFSEYMSDAVGTSRDNMVIEETYDGAVPFRVPGKYTDRTFIYHDAKIPNSVKYGEVVYGLLSYPKGLEGDERNKHLLREIQKRM